MFLNSNENNILNASEDKINALEYYKDYILHGRQIVLSSVVYWDDEKIFRIEAPNFESEQDFYKQLGSIMLLASTVYPCKMLISFGYAVEYENNVIKDSIVTVIANDVGFVAEPFPFEIVNDEVVFDDKIIISDKQCYPNEFNEIVAMGMKISHSIDKLSDILLYLAEKDFNIQFFNNYTIETIDKTCVIPRM